jgi:hypothetical protein
MFEAHPLFNPSPLTHAPRLYHALWLAFRMVLLITAAACTMNKKFPPGLAFGSWVFCMLMLTGYGNNYSLVLLTIPYLLFVSGDVSGKLRAGFSVCIAVAANLRAAAFAGLPILLRFPRTWVLVAAWLLYHAQVNTRIRWKLILPLVIATCCIASFRGKEEAPFVPLPTGLPLVYSFEVKGDSVCFSGLKSGHAGNRLLLQKGCIGPPFRVFSAVRVANTVHHQAMLINDRVLLYLSDRNNLPGFYALYAEPVLK